jgi:hypothetical protein
MVPPAGSKVSQGISSFLLFWTKKRNKRGVNLQELIIKLPQDGRTTWNGVEDG